MWTVSKVQNFVYNESLATLEYGQIVSANVLTNKYGITTQYVYLPNIPFPTNEVQDNATLIIKETLTDQLLTNIFIFTLTPNELDVKIIEVATTVENISDKSIVKE
jgi:hypothetical protein